MELRDFFPIRYDSDEDYDLTTIPNLSHRDNVFLNGVTVWVVRVSAVGMGFCVLAKIGQWVVTVLDEFVNVLLDFLPKLLEVLKLSVLSALIFFGFYAVLKVWWYSRQEF